MTTPAPAPSSKSSGIAWAVLLSLAVLTVAAPPLARRPPPPPTPPPPFGFASPIFNHSMILQRNAPTKLWGRGASPGGTVTVTVTGGGGGALATAAGAVDANGSWTVSIPPPYIPGTLTSIVTATDGGGGTETGTAPATATLADVAWGDVLLCGGQSNMVFGMCATRNATQTAAEALDMVATAAKHGAGIRLFENRGTGGPGTAPCNTTAGTLTSTPQQQWFVPTATAAGAYSAICLLTAHRLYLAEGGNVPIGAVETCVGGTRIAFWTPSTNTTGGLGSLWKAYTAPLVPFTFAAVLWDQGEADEGSGYPGTPREPAAAYGLEFPTLITKWRSAFEMPVTGDRVVPFVYVELDSARQDFWLAQRNATALPAVGFATTVDIEKATHPPDKQAVAQRLAWEVRRLASPNFSSAAVPSKPTPVGVRRVGAAVEFTFSEPVRSLVSPTGFVGKGGLCGPLAPPALQGKDSAAMDLNHPLPKQRMATLNYTVAGNVVTVECDTPNTITELNSRIASCFLYGDGGLPVAPVCVYCNNTATVCAPAV